MTHRFYKTEGIVIKRVNFGEKDRLLTIFTYNFGKLVVIAKGIRAITSKKAPHLEIFTRVSFFAAIGRNIDIVTEAYTLEAFSNLRKNLEKVAFTYGVVEVIDRLCAERQEHVMIYDLLVSTLKKINACNNDSLKSINDEYILKALWDLGYLVHGKQLAGIQLQNFLEEVMEKSLKSNSLMAKI